MTPNTLTTQTIDSILAANEASAMSYGSRGDGARMLSVSPKALGEIRERYENEARQQGLTEAQITHQWAEIQEMAKVEAHAE